MSEMASSATYLSQTIENEAFHRESFHKFFECWLIEQNRYLQDLTAASEEYQTSTIATLPGGTTSETVDEALLRPLINRVIEHYKEYYKAKSMWAKEDATSMFSPTWSSSLEDAFLWIGGWRPSMAFHLLYSKSGQQLEEKLSQLIRGLTTCDLGDLSAAQLAKVDDLQRRTIREEREITEMMATEQEKVADSSMVELSHAVSEMLRAGEAGQNNGSESFEARIEDTLATKEHGLERTLHKADELRLRTLRGIVDILSPIQAVHYLIAAAELHLRLHQWGLDRDARHENRISQLADLSHRESNALDLGRQR